MWMNGCWLVRLCSDQPAWRNKGTDGVKIRPPSCKTHNAKGGSWHRTPGNSTRNGQTADQWLNSCSLNANRTVSCPKGHNKADRQPVLWVKHEQGVFMYLSLNECQVKVTDKQLNIWTLSLSEWCKTLEVSDWLFFFFTAFLATLPSLLIWDSQVLASLKHDNVSCLQHPASNLLTNTVS